MHTQQHIATQEDTKVASGVVEHKEQDASTTLPWRKKKIAVVGPTAAGKSFLCDIAAGSVRPPGTDSYCPTTCVRIVEVFVQGKHQQHVIELWDCSSQFATYSNGLPAILHQLDGVVAVFKPQEGAQQFSECRDWVELFLLSSRGRLYNGNVTAFANCIGEDNTRDVQSMMYLVNHTDDIEVSLRVPIAVLDSVTTARTKLLTFANGLLLHDDKTTDRHNIMQFKP